MARRSRPSPFWEGGYVRLTQRPLHSLLFVLIPLGVYHAYAVRYGTALLAPRDVGRFLRFFGGTAPFLPPLLIVAVLLAQHIAHRHPWRIRPVVLAGMAAESAAWVIPVFSLSYLSTRLTAALQAGPATAPSRPVALVLQAVGAGIYEEFLFRLMFIGLVLLVLVDVLELRRDVSALAAVVVSAVLFSLYHFSSGQFAWGPFVFRFLAGAYLGGLYVARGFGIAAGTHAMWNLTVVWLNT